MATSKQPFFSIISISFGVLTSIGVLLMFIFYMGQSPLSSSPGLFTRDTETNQPNSSNKSANSAADEQTICSICGRAFTGNGYEEVSNGVWKLCSDKYQSQICSRSCGLKHTDEINAIINSLPNNQRSGDGKIYDNNTCPLCRGTGIEKNTSHLTDEVGRVCPMCDGKGVRSY